MKIPKKIKVGGHIYKIELVDSEVLDNDCGKVNKSRNVIQIRKDLPQSQLEETLIHELVHTINFDWNEERVEFVSNAIYQILKDNKWL